MPTTLEEQGKQIINNTQREYNASFGQNGGEYIADTNPRIGVFVYFLPASDGTFGTVISNVIGLTGAPFYQGIPIGFICESFTLAAGSGYLYNQGKL